MNRLKTEAMIEPRALAHDRRVAGDRRARDSWILELTDLNHKKRVEEISELEEARDRLIELVRSDSWIKRASIRSKRNPMRVLYYYYGGLLHNLDRRIADQPNLEDGANIPQ